MRNCRVCGAQFESSPTDYTVNCPKHRGRPDHGSTGGYVPPPVDRHAMGRADGLAGRPALKTAVLAYLRGYDEGVNERKEREDGTTSG